MQITDTDRAVSDLKSTKMKLGKELKRVRTCGCTGFPSPFMSHLFPTAPLVYWLRWLKFKDYLCIAQRHRLLHVESRPECHTPSKTLATQMPVMIMPCGPSRQIPSLASPLCFFPSFLPYYGLFQFPLVASLTHWPAMPSPYPPCFHCHAAIRSFPCYTPRLPFPIPVNTWHAMNVRYCFLRYLDVNVAESQGFPLRLANMVD